MDGHCPVPGQSSSDSLSKVLDSARFLPGIERCPFDGEIGRLKRPFKHRRSNKTPTGHPTVPVRCHCVLNDPTIIVREPALFK